MKKLSLVVGLFTLVGVANATQVLTEDSSVLGYYKLVEGECFSITQPDRQMLAVVEREKGRILISRFDDNRVYVNFLVYNADFGWKISEPGNRGYYNISYVEIFNSGTELFALQQVRRAKELHQLVEISLKLNGAKLEVNAPFTRGQGNWKCQFEKVMMQ